MRRTVVRLQTVEAGFPAAEYLSARLEIDGEERSGSPEAAAQLESLTYVRRTHQEIERRLRGESAGAGVTFTTRLPRTVHPQRWLEIDGAALGVPAAGRRFRISTVSVAVNYFDAIGARIVSGRAFQPGDLSGDARYAIVNQSFVQRVLQGRNAVGRRVRGWLAGGKCGSRNPKAVV